MGLERIVQKMKTIGRKFLIGAVLASSLSFGACVKEIFVEEPQPQGNPPAKASITQILPLAQEPNRGMHLMIYDASDDEDGFNIERKVYGGTFAPLGNLSQNASKYDDWGVEMSTTYTYRIRAYNEFGNSAWSEKTETSRGPELSSMTAKPSADTYVKEANPNKNYGGEKYFTVAGYDNGHEFALLSFSLPNLPSYTKEFKSAKLRLCEAGGGNTIYPGSIGLSAAPVLDSWNENTVTWGTRPGTWLSTYGYSVHNPNNNSCVHIDVSNVVSDWYSNVRPNLGFNIFSGSNSYCSYYSKEGYEPGSGTLQVEYVW